MSRKTDNADKALQWVKDISSNKLMFNACDKSIKEQKFYRNTLYSESDEKYVKSKLGSRLHVEMTSETTHEAVLRLCSDGYFVCALNFASYFNPGGGFLKGSMAQEESLCAASGLYKILYDCPVYDYRHHDRNVPPEYRDEMIYSPKVPFVDEPYTMGMLHLCDVVSVSAPNCNRVSVTRTSAVNSAIERRLTACYIQPYIHGCNALVLGAWGCGVFKNDPATIANTMYNLNETYGCAYDRIVFALPNENLRKVFESILLQ